MIFEGVVCSGRKEERGVSGHQPGLHLVKHGESGSFPTPHQRLPLQLHCHITNTRCSPVTVTDKSGCSPLHHLKLMLLVCPIGAPYGTGILNYWPNICEVGLLFDSDGADA